MSAFIIIGSLIEIVFFLGWSSIHSVVTDLISVDASLKIEVPFASQNSMEVFNSESRDRGPRPWVFRS